MTTSSRRDFLSIAAAGSALAASGVFSAGAVAAPADMPQGGGGGGRYVPPVKFGLGGVPFGNEFEVVSDEDAYKTLEAAWNAGVRYYDVAPCPVARRGFIFSKHWESISRVPELLGPQAPPSTGRAGAVGLSQARRPEAARRISRVSGLTTDKPRSRRLRRMRQL